jgi:alkylation response protein AidB-like acyl-CoA dehydrogenase
MYNFNHERFIIIVQTVRLARVCYEESFNYANKRKTFGKKLIEHQGLLLVYFLMESDSCKIGKYDSSN